MLQFFVISVSCSSNAWYFSALASFLAVFHYLSHLRFKRLWSFSLSLLLHSSLEQPKAPLMAVQTAPTEILLYHTERQVGLSRGPGAGRFWLFWCWKSNGGSCLLFGSCLVFSGLVVVCCLEGKIANTTRVSQRSL